MCVIRWFLLKSCIFGMYILVTESSVSLQTFDGKTTYLKGSNVTLVCTITPYNNVMTWYVDNDAYAGCFLGTCSASANKPYTFTFDFDDTAGVFNLTIYSVDSSHAALSFVCDDGNVPKTIYINVTTVNIPIEKGAGPCGTLCIVLICVGIFLLLIIFLVIIIHYCVQPKFTWIELEDKQIHLNWTDILNCCCEKIFEYNIVRNPIKGNVTDNYCRQQSTKEKYCTLTKLDPMAVYEIRLCRTLCCFKSLAKKRFIITQKSAMLNDQDDQGYHAKSTSIDVRWTKPDCITNPQLKYQVTCNEEVKKGQYDQTNITLKDLIPGKMYKIEVFAIDEGTDILLLAKKIPTTPGNIPAWETEPTPKSTEIELKWKRPEYTGDEPLEYEVTCNKEVVAKTANTSYTIENCKPQQNYDIEIISIITKNGMKSLPLRRTIKTMPPLPYRGNVQHGGNHHPPNSAVDTV